MSTKKIFFPFATFFILALVLIITSIYLLVPTPESDDKIHMQEVSAEVKAFNTRFEANRKNAEITIEESRIIANKWIKKERALISRHLFYRRRAYDLIAKAILNVQTYEELNAHLSRLPSTEKQAYTTLTIDRSSIVTLDNYAAYIPSLLFPIQLPDNPNSGSELLISSGFSSKRISPVGSGGARPHYAVDIINIGNIDYVTEEGELVRDGNHPGFIVAAAKGIVTNMEYNSIYGWNVTIEHNRDLIPSRLRKEFESFETFYAHLDEMIYINIGEELRAGDHIALVGNSGLSTGPHLHYEVRLNRYDGSQLYVNPYPGSEW
jgi:murein DD-endopeptidase MepM/ murein hydrolase activator NlpD